MNEKERRETAFCLNIVLCVGIIVGILIGLCVGLAISS